MERLLCSKLCNAGGRLIASLRHVSRECDRCAQSKKHQQQTLHDGWSLAVCSDPGESGRCGVNEGKEQPGHGVRPIWTSWGLFTCCCEHIVLILDRSDLFGAVVEWTWLLSADNA